MIAACLWFSPGMALAQDTPKADDILGLWRTGERNGSWGYVRFERCGAAYCGSLIGGGGKTVNKSYFGTRIVRGMTWEKTRFTGGRVLDVERGVWYRAKFEFRGKTRALLYGCVLGGAICGSQTWRRVSRVGE